MNKYPDKKGIIHSNSFELASWIARDIKDPRLVYHDSSNKDLVLQEHYATDKPTVIVSPSMDTGVSFDDDKARFQVIAKIPYPSLASQKNKLRQKNNPDWYTWKTISGLIQMTGRAVRSNYDYASRNKSNKDKESNNGPWLKMKKGAVSWTININEADAKEWHDKTRLPMNIVHQIINYKNHLGGFTHPMQLKKVYGLADTTFQNLRPHLVVQKNFKPLLNSSTMNFAQWKSLGIFEDQQLYEILKLRKQQGGQVSWRELVILFDLPEKQALWLKSQIIISD